MHLLVVALFWWINSTYGYNLWSTPRFSKSGTSLLKSYSENSKNDDSNGDNFDFKPLLKSRDELFGIPTPGELSITNTEKLIVTQSDLPLGLRRYVPSEFKLSKEDGLEILEQVDCFRFMVDESALQAAIEKGTALQAQQLSTASPSGRTDPEMPRFLLDSSIVEALSLQEQPDSAAVRTVHIDFDELTNGVKLIEQPEEADIDDLNERISDYNLDLQDRNLLTRLGLENLSDNNHKRNSIVSKLLSEFFLSIFRISEAISDLLGSILVLFIGSITLSISSFAEIKTTAAVKKLLSVYPISTNLLISKESSQKIVAVILLIGRKVLRVAGLGFLGFMAVYIGVVVRLSLDSWRKNS